MGVRVRQKIKSRGNPYWVFIAHKGKRTSRMVGDKIAAEYIASKIRADLIYHDLIKPKILNRSEIDELVAKILDIVKECEPGIALSSWNKIKQRISRERLENSYLKELLNKQYGSLKESDRLIGLKKEQVQLKRLIKTAKEALNGNDSN